jgi:rRNA maturation endonuclease Nob1
MARFRCRACGSEGTFAYSSKHECPNCGSDNVQFALSIEELGDDDPLIVALTKMAENDTED